MRRVHQPDDGMVDGRREGHALDEIGPAAVANPSRTRDFGRRSPGDRRKRPRCCPAPRAPGSAGTDAAGVKGLAGHQRGDRAYSGRRCRTASHGSSTRSRCPSNRPAVSGMPRCGQRSRSANTAPAASRPSNMGSPNIISPAFAAPQPPARRGVIPGLAQRRSEVASRPASEKDRRADPLIRRSAIESRDLLSPRAAEPPMSYARSAVLVRRKTTSALGVKNALVV